MDVSCESSQLGIALVDIEGLRSQALHPWVAVKESNKSCHDMDTS